MSSLCSLAPLLGPLEEPRLRTASAPQPAPAKPALAQRKARARPGTHPGSSVFFPFRFLCDSWNVFAHGGKNAKSRERRPGTPPSLSPSLPALGCGASRRSGSRQHRYPGKSEEPLMPAAVELPRDELNFGGNPFCN